MLENTKSKNKEKGNLGEEIVKNYLEENNCKILCRNFQSNFGEIDIIFRDKNELVFAEIKSRTGIEYGFPAESVNKIKENHILNTARYFLYKTGLLNQYIRFDVIEVYLFKSKAPLINHIKNVFW